MNNFKTQIGLLVKLQEQDTQIDAIRQEKKEAPLKLKELDELFNQKKNNLAELVEKGKLIIRQRKEKELELGAKEEEKRKIQGQLYQLKTNKEYDAKLKEIKGSEADASVLEDEILKFFEEADKVNTEVAKEKEFLAEEEKRVNAQKQEINSAAKELDGKLLQLESGRKQLADQVDAKLLSEYSRILTNCGYLAIAKVENNACHGCFMNVPPQVINLILMHEKLIICGACHRILYIEDSLS